MKDRVIGFFQGDLRRFPSGDQFTMVNRWLAEHDVHLKKMFMTPLDLNSGFFWIWYEEKYDNDGPDILDNSTRELPS